ncbi:hypothetical protein JHN55_14825 [Streptomyces sp. MBT56]|uniref:hypothetical protein n=1 Tax=unclassified Streptomyces TaxID=2593676 RepID=UPI00190D32AA|nr:MULTISPECIES: hypothetical protein [unclassified Streptomyces]MBK3557778.1 hypothetical protein [Streptomyces sp. MBT56]MBK3600719.1 hypothetical protein [Streptomyces sp. MBT54]MBK3614955.1 hypothetical protein [Streptomyces sp. MBT98]MBK6044440.1 hypothetical protein [Streptomyces sp. MBT55]
MTSTEAAAIALQDNAALWSAGEISASEVVDAACDALVAGLDTPGLRILAARTRAEADYDVYDLLPPALDELGLAEVTAEARRLAAHPRVPTAPEGIPGVGEQGSSRSR